MTITYLSPFTIAIGLIAIDLNFILQSAHHSGWLFMLDIFGTVVMAIVLARFVVEQYRQRKDRK
jgi:hypothetical protein